MRFVERCRQVVIVTKMVDGDNRHQFFSVVESGKVDVKGFDYNINDRVNHGVELGTIDIFVESVSRVITARKIDEDCCSKVKLKRSRLKIKEKKWHNRIPRNSGKNNSASHARRVCGIAKRHLASVNLQS